MNDKGLKTGAVIVEDDSEILGVNDRMQLEHLTNVLKRRINTEHMKNGVTLIDFNNTYIYDNVQIGKDTIIYPNVVISEGAVIGDNCTIRNNAYIGENVVIKNDTVIDVGEKII